jgi:heme oxygenase
MNDLATDLRQLALLLPSQIAKQRLLDIAEKVQRMEEQLNDLLESVNLDEALEQAEHLARRQAYAQALTEGKVIELSRSPNWFEALLEQ